MCDNDEISDYSEETIEKANVAFWLGENGKDNFKQLEYAANKNYKYALIPYAQWLLKKRINLERACECILMAAKRNGPEDITIPGKTENEIDILITNSLNKLNKINKQQIKRWISGYYLNKKRPKSIQIIIEDFCKEIRF